MAATTLNRVSLTSREAFSWAAEPQTSDSIAPDRTTIRRVLRSKGLQSLALSLWHLAFSKPFSRGADLLSAKCQLLFSSLRGAFRARKLGSSLCHAAGLVVRR